MRIRRQIRVTKTDRRHLVFAAFGNGRGHLTFLWEKSSQVATAAAVFSVDSG